MFKVTAHVFRNEGKGGKVGQLTFVSPDHTLASELAGNIGFNEGHTCHVDFEVSARLGRRSVWIDCNPHSLDAAANELMSLASDIRNQRKPRTVAAE